MTNQWTKPTPRQAYIHLGDGRDIPLVAYYEGLDDKGYRVWGLYVTDEHDGDVMVRPGQVSLRVDVIPAKSAVRLGFEDAPDGWLRVLPERDRPGQ